MTALTETRPGSRLHYAWIVVAVTFLVLLVGAGVRATPSVLIVPWERELGWTATTIGVGIALYFAFAQPFVGALQAAGG